MSLFDLIAQILDFFYSVTHNYGLAIVGLTLAVMLLVTPFTFKGTKSMLQMQRLQPEIKKLQNRYKDDRQKLNEEMLKFYRENNINPVGGCLPLLIQLPIFFVLYRVIIGLTYRGDYGVDMGQLVGRGLAGEPSFPEYGFFHPRYLKPGSELYHSLSDTREMTSFGLDLAESASNAIGRGLGHGWPYIVLILLIGVTSWFQQRQIQGRMKGTQVNPQQQMLMKIMPFGLPIISLTLPAAVTLYFVVSNLWRIGQQAFITRTLYADGVPGATVVDDGAPKEKVSFRDSLRQMRESMELPDTKGQRVAKPKPAAKAGAAKSGTAKSAAKSKAGTKTGSSPSRKPPAAKSAGADRSPSRTPPAPNRARNKKKRR